MEETAQRRFLKARAINFACFMPKMEKYFILPKPFPRQSRWFAKLLTIRDGARLRVMNNRI
jgi:hypothetical protein